MPRPLRIEFEGAWYHIWSSYKAYSQDKSRPEWLHIDEVLRIGHNKFVAFDYCEFVNQGVDKEILDFYSKSKRSSILGDKSFKELQLKKLVDKKICESKHELKRTCDIPPLHIILEVIANYYGVDIRNLKQSLRGVRNFPRLMGMFVCRKAYGYKCRDIAEVFGSITASAVSAVTGRFKWRLVENNNKAQKEYREILSRLKLK